MIIAIDFDGTIVEDRYPRIGALKTDADKYLKLLRQEGYSLILWTCRTGKELAQAVKFCAEQGIRFDEINKNLRSQIVHYNSDPRKIGASLYIDDRGIIPLPEWSEIYELVHQLVPSRLDLIDKAIGM